MIVFDDRYWKRLIAITTRWFTCLNVYKFNDCESTACFDKKKKRKKYKYVRLCIVYLSKMLQSCSRNFAYFRMFSNNFDNFRQSLQQQQLCSVFFSTLCCDFTRDKFADFIIYNSNYYLIYYLMTVKEMHHHPLTN